MTHFVENHHEWGKVRRCARNRIDVGFVLTSDLPLGAYQAVGSEIADNYYYLRKEYAQLPDIGAGGRRDIIRGSIKPDRTVDSHIHQQRARLASERSLASCELLDYSGRSIERTYWGLVI